MKNTSKIAILGYGFEGANLEKYLHERRIKNITILDQKNGPGYLKNLHEYDIIYRSPGIYRFKKEIVTAEKKGVKISSATKLFFDEFEGKIIAVTGTNGKGTTSTLINKILRKAGQRVFLSGNIGTTNLLDILTKPNQKGSYAVLELSSFQTIDLDKGPYISVILNITTDHLDWHKNRNEYVKAKAQLVRHQKQSDYAVINDEYETSRGFKKLTKAKVVFFNKKTSDGYLSNLLGEHNKENIAAAISVARILKVPEGEIRSAIKGYKPMPHRLEFVRKIGNIKFYNDSCATSEQPTIAAINSFQESLTLIIGGYDKGLDYTNLFKTISSKKNINTVITIGDLSTKFEKALKNMQFSSKLLNLGHVKMKTIVKTATTQSSTKSVILFSPAAASFDMFQDYKDRGDQFKKVVKTI